ncbi:MAG: phosphoenolpyruvate carboxykinase [Candidatus Baldrarchaeia archaeon]
MREMRDFINEVLKEATLIENPKETFLENASKGYAVPNKLGVLLFHTRVRARSPQKTIENVNLLPEEEKKKIIEELEKVREFLRGKKLIVVDRNIGNTDRFRMRARAIISAKYPHLALMFARNYFPPSGDTDIPEIVSLCIPEWPYVKVIVDPEELINIILGVDYYGELKMSFLRLAMNYARDKMGMLGLHAGSKLYIVRNNNGEFVKRGVLIFGLSGTGKSTVTMANNGLSPGERVVVRQDDIVILTPDGMALGTERNLYPKTDSINSIPPLLQAVKHPLTILENVAVKDDGTVDFDDVDFCPNGRAIIIRRAIPLTDERVDLERVDILLFLTRRKEMPIAAKTCSPGQAVAYFMLGESIMTSAGTMKKEEMGRPIRVPGFDPFMLQPKSRTANLLYKFLKRHTHVQTCILNTGYVGDVKVTPEDTMKTVLSIVKGTIKWKYDPNLKMEVPAEIPGVDLEKYDPYRIFGEEKYKEIMERLREDRIRYLRENFPDLEYLFDHV